MQFLSGKKGSKALNLNPFWCVSTRSELVAEHVQTSMLYQFLSEHYWLCVLCVTDNVSYERSALDQWFSRGRLLSPSTGHKIKSTSSRPNNSLKDAIRNFLRMNPKCSPGQSSEKKTEADIDERLGELRKMSIGNDSVDSTDLSPVCFTVSVIS